MCDEGTGLPGGKYKLGKQSLSHQNTSEVYVREAEEAGLTTAFHLDKNWTYSALFYGIMEDKSKSPFGKLLSGWDFL